MSLDFADQAAFEFDSPLMQLRLALADVYVLS